MNTRDYLIGSIASINFREWDYIIDAGMKIQGSILIDAALSKPKVESKHKLLAFKSIPKFSI